MAEALRPSEHLTDKQNVNPSINRSTEVTAEDFHHIAEVLDNHALLIDSNSRSDEQSKFYDFHSSLQSLQAAFPVAEENGWAVINPGDGNPITIARFLNGQWVEEQNIAPIQIYNTIEDLPSQGAAGIWYIVRDVKLAHLWYDNKYNAFGKDGANGLSAYQHAVSLGFEGTLQEWLDSLQGDEGKSAYQSALDNGFVGTETEWLESLEGEPGAPGGDGDPGDSAYELALANGFVGTEAEWLESLEGEPGEPGEVTTAQMETYVEGKLYQAPITISTSRLLALTDKGRKLYITAPVTLTYPAAGLGADFEFNAATSDAGILTMADEAATPGDDLDSPDGLILTERKMMHAFVVNSKLALYGDMTE